MKLARKAVLALGLQLLATLTDAQVQPDGYGVTHSWYRWSDCLNYKPSGRTCMQLFPGYSGMYDRFQNRAGHITDYPDGPAGDQGETVVADCPYSEWRVRCNACDIGHERWIFGLSFWFSPTGFWDTTPYSCQECRVGRYQDEIAGGGSSARPYNASATKVADECKVCPSGTYQDETGGTSCKLCEAGKYQPSDTVPAAGCTDCPNGRYGDVEGLTECKLCPKGRYNWWGLFDTTECEACPAGRTTAGNGTVGSWDCIDINECAPNYDGPGACDQLCFNTDSSKFCYCVGGYDRKGDHCFPMRPLNMSHSYRAFPRESSRCPTCYDVDMRYNLTLDVPPPLIANGFPLYLDADLSLRAFGSTQDPELEEVRLVPGSETTYSAVIAPRTGFRARARYVQDVTGTTQVVREVSPWFPEATEDNGGFVTYGDAPCGCLTPRETTGMPTDLRVTQQSAGSDIYFLIGWTDGSLCETAFFITRVVDGNEVTIGSYPSANSGVSAGACGRTYDPDTPEVRDSITDVQADPPGSSRTYCVASTGVEYVSDSVCETVTIAWFTVAQVTVLTTRGNGVPRVDLAWEILGHNENATGVVLAATGSDGTYDLKMKVEDFANITANVRITPSKMTGSSNHTFEYANAPVSYIDIELGHLDTTPINIIDTSGFTASGRILMDDSLSLGISCGSEGVEVCAVPLSDATTLPECTTTDAAGDFEVPIVIGGSFRIEAALGNHTFESAQDGTASHTIASVTEDVPLVDFTDTTTSEATVVVAGGLCNFDIGRAQLEFRSASNCLVHTVWQDDWRRTYTLPAMDMTIAVNQLDTVTGVSGDDARAYLERVNERTQRANFKELSAATREFVYHPQPTVAISSPASFMGDCQTYRVMKSLFGYDVSIGVSQDFGAAGICHDVAGNVTLQDNLLDTAECATGCILPLVQETQDIYGVGTVVTGSAARKKLIAGPPNLFPPHTLSVSATFGYAGQDQVQVVEDFFVEGEVILGASFSVDFPRGLPLMVLHDPPGFGSYSTFSDVSEATTTISVSTTESEENSGSLKIHAGYAGEHDSCLGAIAAYYCTEVIEISASAYAQVDVGETHAEEEEYGMDFTVGYAQGYSTAGADLGDFSNPGRDSTMILSTALNLRFSKVDRVSLNESTCQGQVTRFIAWEPESPDSGDVVFWRSIWDVENVIVPELEDALVAQNQGANLTQIASAIAGWRDVVAYIDETRTNASQTVSLTGANAAAVANGVAGLSRISWGGGGSSFSYSTTTTNSESQTFTRELGISGALAAGFETELTVGGATVGFAGDYTLTLDFNVGRSESTEKSLTTDVTFTLFDEDLGDYFVTEVLQDTVFGVPVFRTLSGTSMCPHEEGTVAREQVRLRLNDGVHAAFTGVPPEDHRIVELEMCNESPTDDDLTMELIAPPGDNPGSLGLETSGVSIARALQYDLPAGSCITSELRVERGYSYFSYDDVLVSLRSLCDDIEDTATISIDYIVPCAAVEFSGYLADEEYWYVSTVQRHALPGVHDDEVLIVLFNPLVAGLPWSSHPRLQSVRLDYRVASSGRGAAGPWQPAIVSWRDSADDEITPGTHDAYGYARLWWNVAPLTDGYYEIRAVAECEATAASTAAYDETTTAILAGHIDRSAPVLLQGFSEPADGVFSIGDEISVTFDERVLCSTMTLTLTVPATGDSIDERLLEVICGGATTRIRFGLALDLDRVIGHQVTLQISGVTDTSRNSALADSEWSFSVPAIDAANTQVSVNGLRIHVDSNPCELGLDSHDCLVFRGELEAEIAELIGASSTRIQVQSVVMPEAEDAALAEEGAAASGGVRRLQEGKARRMRQARWRGRNPTWRRSLSSRGPAIGRKPPPGRWGARSTSTWRAEASCRARTCRRWTRRPFSTSAATCSRRTRAGAPAADSASPRWTWRDPQAAAPSLPFSCWPWGQWPSSDSSSIGGPPRRSRPCTIGTSRTLGTLPRRWSRWSPRWW